MFALGSCWLQEQLYVFVTLYHDRSGKQYRRPFGWAVNIAKDAARSVRSTKVSGDALSVLERCTWLIVERRHWNGPPRGRDP